MKPADFAGFTKDGCDTLARILRRVVRAQGSDEDCVECGGWGTLLRDGKLMQCKCSESVDTKGTK